jgi:hypothetical protein
MTNVRKPWRGATYAIEAKCVCLHEESRKAPTYGLAFRYSSCLPSTATSLSSVVVLHKDPINVWWSCQERRGTKVSRRRAAAFKMADSLHPQAGGLGSSPHPWRLGRFYPPWPASSRFSGFVTRYWLHDVHVRQVGVEVFALGHGLPCREGGERGRCAPAAPRKSAVPGQFAEVTLPSIRPKPWL